MSPLALIWWTALGLAAFALIVMAGLIASRVRRTRSETRSVVVRRQVVRAMTALVAGDETASESLAALHGETRVLVETLLDFLDMVRGGDRERLRDLLTAIGLEDRLRRDCRGGERGERLRAVEALALFPGPRTVAALRDALRDPDTAVSLAALRSLANMEAAPDLSEILARAGPGWISSRLFADLMVVVARTRAAEVRTALADPGLSRSLKVLLFESLAAAGDYAALPLLCQAAGDPDDKVRAAGMRALGALAHPSAGPILQLGLGDGDQEVRAAAVAAVGRAGLVALAPALGVRLNDGVWWVRHEAAEALALLGAPGLAILNEAASSAEPAGRRSAALALAVRSVA